MNNAAASLSYFVIIQDQTLANLGLALAMLVVVAIMFAKKLFVLDELFLGAGAKPTLLKSKP